MTGTVHRQTSQAVELAQMIVDNRFPGARFEWPLGDITDAVSGFAVYFDDVLSLIQASATDSSETWGLAVTSGIAIDLEDISAALSWANSTNGEIGIGRFFCPILEQPRAAAILYEDVIWGGIFNSIFDHRCGEEIRNSMVRRVSSEIASAIAASAQCCREVLDTQRGRAFTKADLNALSIMRAA